MAKTPTPASRNAAPAKPQGRAAQAARSQGREPEPERRAAAPANKSSVPANRKPAPPPAEVSTANMPAFMRQDVDVGKEAIGREDLETPRLKLIQALSPELHVYNDLRPGQFFHTAAEQILEGPLTTVPVFMERRYLLWRPQDSGGGILARADDGIHWSPSAGEFTVQLNRNQGGKTVTWKLAPTVERSGLANWGTSDPDNSNSPPAATLMYNFVLAFPDYPDLMPAVFTFQRSLIKVGRKLNTKLKTTRLPIFGLKFDFAPFLDHNAANQDFYSVNVVGNGMVEDEDQYNLYRDMHNAFRTTGLQIKDIETLQEEDVDGANDDGEDGKPQTGHRRF